MDLQVTVTESLANGLKNRFFYEMTEGSDRAEKIFISEASKLKHDRNGFSKLARVVRESFQDYTLVIYEGGSTRKPYLSFDLLTVVKDREFNSWNEKCLTGDTLLFSLDPRYFNHFYTTYNIGEHAIARLFLRTKPKINNGVVDCKYIKDELIHVPLWAAYWGITLFGSTSKDYFGRCFPVIPAPSGLLMCEFSRETHRIEVRTFVDDANLSHEQLEAKQLLLDAGKGLLDSPLSMFGVLSASNIDSTDLLHSILSSRLHKDFRWATLQNVIFHRVIDDKERISLKKELDVGVRNFSRFTDESTDAFLQTVGVRKFQSEVKKALLPKAEKT
jgi:hypothetical protein